MKTSVYIGASLDGFIARNDGDIDWLTPYSSDELFKAYVDFARDIDAIVMGSGTYEKVITFPTWPYDKPVYVLSSRLKQPPEGLQAKVLFIEMTPAQVLQHVAANGHAHAYVDGGKVIQQFLAADLIDRLIIGHVPIIIGAGIPLFGVVKHDLSFKHLRTEVFRNGVVQSYYQRERKQ
jgi:dihydrofolate reductase